MMMRRTKKKTIKLINDDFIKKAARLLKGEHLEDNERKRKNRIVKI